MRTIILCLAVGILCCTLAPSPAAADRLQEIQDRKVLRVGVKDAVPPFGYIDLETRTIIGFDVDIATAVARRLNVKAEFTPVTSTTRIPLVAKGEIDMAASTMTHTFERDAAIDFSITYFMDGQRLLVSTDSPVTGVAHLQGRRVGTVRGSTSSDNLRNAQPESIVVEYEGYPQAFLALQQGKVDALSTDATILLGLKNTAKDKDQWVVVGDTISEEPYGLGLPENESNFRDAVNKALADMWREGEYRSIYDTWFGPDSDFHLPLTWRMEVWPN